MTFSLKTLMLAGMLLSAVAVEGRVFTRCELAQELKSQGFPVHQLTNWVCLVESESSRNTQAMNTNTNGSSDFGLFQINDGYWCEHDRPGKDCDVICSDLLLDDITIASRCAKIIYNRHQFTAWHGWTNRCQGELPDISMCGVL